MNKIKIVGIILFCGMLFMGGMASVILPSKEYSNRENRVLETRPEPVWEDILSGSYQEQYEIYLNDQMIVRDEWVRLAVGLEQLVGRQEVNGVYIGKDGYLLEKYNPSAFDATQTEENIDALCAFLNDAAKQYGKGRVSCLLLPDKAAAMPDKLPDGADRNRDEEEAAIAKLTEQLEEPEILLDATTELQRHQEEYIYYRTDHHWTTLGAYYAYCMWANMTGHTAEKLETYSREEIFEDFYGTTYNKAPVRVPMDSVELFHSQWETGVEVDQEDGKAVTDSFYFPGAAVEGFNRYQIFFSGNMAKIQISTKAETERSLLVIKDSFANCFVPFLAGEYEEIIMVDFRYGTENIYDILEEYEEITDVLVLYNIQNLMQDKNFHKLDKEAETMEKFDADSFFDDDEDDEDDEDNEDDETDEDDEEADDEDDDYEENDDEEEEEDIEEEYRDEDYDEDDYEEEDYEENGYEESDDEESDDEEEE